jgi:hypothetical protein
MPAKANPAGGNGGARGDDRSRRLIDHNHKPDKSETQAGARLAAYTVDASLVLIEARYA